jgi:hypothetical protein
LLADLEGAAAVVQASIRTYSPRSDPGTCGIRPRSKVVPSPASAGCFRTTRTEDRQREGQAPRVGGVPSSGAASRRLLRLLASLGLPGCGCPASCSLWCRLHHLSALPLRGQQALRHGADLSDPSGSDPPGRAPHQAMRSVGCSAGGGSWVVSKGGVRCDHLGNRCHPHQCSGLPCSLCSRQSLRSSVATCPTCGCGRGSHLCC